jgi:hypothetical protein
MSVALMYILSMPQSLMFLLFSSAIIVSLVGLLLSLRDLLRWRRK